MSEAQDAYEFDVAVSFASEDTEYVEDFVVTLLDHDVRVFFHVYETPWTQDLNEYLIDIYQHRARYCVAFISRSYCAKPWPRRELLAARSAVFTRNDSDYLIVARFDDTPVPGALALDHFVDLRTMEPEDLANIIIVEKLKLPPPPTVLPPRYIRTGIALGLTAGLIAAVLMGREAVEFLRRSFGDSHTTINVGIATADSIPVQLKNDGRKPSDLTGVFLLRFNGLPIEEAKLRLAGRNPRPIAVPPRSDLEIDLTVAGLMPSCNNGKRLNNTEMDPLLGNGTATLRIAVTESDAASGSSVFREQTVPAKILKPFIMKKVPGHVPTCESR